MKKTILILFSAALLLSCSSRKKNSDSAFMKGFFSYYNTLFNSKDALETELRNRDRAHRDNFNAPYISLLTYDEVAEANDAEGFNTFSGPGVPSGNRPAGRRGATILEISEAKALKAIEKYSVMKNGEERNKRMFDAHILLAQARLYNNKPLEALDGLNYIFANMRNDKRLPLARIYQGLAYAKMENYHRAEEVFADLKNNDLKKDYQKLLSVYYSEMLLDAGKEEAAVDELSDAYTLNKDRKLRSRIAFLRGQILAHLNENEAARESFVTAYKNANDFEFEVKAQVEIAKTYNGSDEDYRGAREYLEKISKKGTYASRKNEFYYALGLMAKKAGKKEEAQQYFTRALNEKVSDPHVRGLTYFEIGRNYFNYSDYLSAGAYYDSALAVMTYAPTKTLLEEQTANIKNVSSNYYTVKRSDSILNLIRMPEGERTAYFMKYIDQIKAKEQREELELKKRERGKGFDTGDYDANSMFAKAGGGFQDFSPSKGGFYFSNLGTVAKGESTFRQIWGNRTLSDNWRTSARSNTIEDLRNEAMGISAAPNPRRLEPEFYTEQIPTDQLEIAALRKARDTAALGLGRMYENFFGDTELATKTLYTLADSEPEDEVRLQALYHIFAFNYEKNPQAAQRAKHIILTEFPYTSYAEFVKNPQSNSFSQSSEAVEQSYEKAFALYDEGNYEESRALIDEAIAKYPKDALIPKFSLLNAFNTGKTAGKEIMILQLEQIALNYARTPEGEKAAEMLKYLKSDLSVERTDETGADPQTEDYSDEAPSIPINTAPGVRSPMASPGLPPTRDDDERRSRSETQPRKTVPPVPELLN